MTHSVTLTVYKVTNYETNITPCGNAQNFLMLQHVVDIVTTNSQYNNNNSNNSINNNSTTADGFLTTGSSNYFWTIFSNA
jgi:hypothetical protein